MSPKYLAVALVIFLTGLLIAVLVRRRKRKSTFVMSPREHAVEPEAAGLFAALSSVAAIGSEVEKIPAIPAVADLPYRTKNSIIGAQKSAMALRTTLGFARKRLGSMEPNYSNYAAVYSGLSGVDMPLLNAADAYTFAGRQLFQDLTRDGAIGTSGAMVAGPWGRQEMPPSELVEAGNALIELGNRVRRVVRAIHRLGAALDLE